jgi:hypothetical protein
MRLPLFISMCAAVLLLCAPAATAQQPDARGESAPAASARKPAQDVSGRVVSVLDQHPLAHAMVSLQQTKSRQNVLSTTTDDEGRFRFDAVPAGKYRLQGQARGFQAATYLQHEQFDTAIVTGAGLATDALVLELTPLARISGRILDEAGDPVAGASVELFRTIPGSAPERITRIRAAQTSDDGAYELDRLPPGRYFLAAHGTPWYAVHPQPDQENAGFWYAVNVDPKLDVAYPEVFYPHALDPAEATPFEVKGGEQIAADLQMQPQPAVSLRFEFPASDGPNRSYPYLTRTVFGVEEPVPLQTYGYNRNQGVIVGLAPGQYHVQLSDPLRGRALVNVGNVDLTSGSTSLDLSRPPDLATVTLTVHGSGDETLRKGAQVVLHSLNSNQEGVSSAIDEKGVATIAGVAPGDYRLQFLGARHPVNLLSLSVDGKPQADKRLHVAGSGSVSGEATTSSFSATIDGRVLRDGKPDAACMVALIPAGTDTSESLFRRDQSDLDGSFSMGDVVAGKYLIVAIDDGWPLRWSDPVAMARYLAHGTPIEVSPSGPKEIELSAPVAAQPR